MSIVILLGLLIMLGGILGVMVFRALRQTAGTEEAQASMADRQAHYEPISTKKGMFNFSVGLLAAVVVAAIVAVACIVAFLAWYARSI